MSMFSAKVKRPDPYKFFKCKVKFEGRYVAGFNKYSIMTRDTKISELREVGEDINEYVILPAYLLKSLGLSENIFCSTSNIQMQNTL